MNEPVFPRIGGSLLVMAGLLSPVWVRVGLVGLGLTILVAGEYHQLRGIPQTRQKVSAILTLKFTPDLRRVARRLSLRGRTRIVFELLLAGLVVIVIAYLAAAAIWPFDDKPTTLSQFRAPTLTEYLLSDRILLGMAKLGALALAGFVVVSVPVLAVKRQWITEIGTGGIKTQKQEVGALLTEYEEQLKAARDERDKAKADLKALARTAEEASRLYNRRQDGTPSGNPAATGSGEEGQADPPGA